MALHALELADSVLVRVRLAELDAVEVGHLIGADDDGAGVLVPDCAGLHFGKAHRGVLRRFAGQGGFVNVGAFARVGDAKTVEELAAVAGARGKNELFGHSGSILAALSCAFLGACLLLTKVFNS